MQVTIVPCSFYNKIEIIKWFRRLTGAVFGSPFPLRACVQIMKQLDDGSKIVFDVPDTDDVRKVLDEGDFYNVIFTENHPSGWIDLAAIKTSIDADKEMEKMKMYYNVYHDGSVVGTYIADNEEDAIVACVGEYEGQFPSGCLRAEPVPSLPPLNANPPHEEGWYWARYAGGVEVVYVFECTEGWGVLMAGRTSTLPISRFCAWSAKLPKPQY